MSNRRLPPQVLLLGFAALLNDAASEMVYPLLPLFLTTLGATPLVIGLIEGTADAVASVLKFFAGSWSDRLRRRKPLVVGGYALAAASRALIAVASAWSVVLSARLLDRTGKGIRSAPRDALIADVADPGQRGRAFGFHRALDHTGAVIGPLVAVVLLQALELSIRQVFFFAVIPGAIGVLLLIVALREGPRAAVSTPERQEPPASEGAGAPLRPPFRKVIFAVALFSLANSSDAFLILQAHAAGVSAAMLPLLWAAHHVVKALFSTWAGGLSDRIGRPRLIVAGWASYAVVYAIFPFASSLTAFAALFIAYSIPFTLSEGPERALISDLAPAGAKGRAFGIYYLVTGAGVLVGSALFGLLYQSLSPAAAFGTASALAIAAAVVISDNARMLKSAAILLLALVAVPAVAQLPLSESIEVRVVNVEVVVTDAAGKPVTGLSRQDFEILEDGKPQTITNLYEVRNGEAVASGEAAGAPPAAPRRFVFFIDNDSLHPYNRRQIVASLEKFIDTHLQPGDLTSVVMWDRSLSVLAPLTDDRRLLAAAIRTVAEGGTGASIKTQIARVQAECVRVLDNARTGGIPAYVAYEECISILRGEMQATALKSRQLLNAVDLTLTTIAGSEGRKILVLAGALLPKNPGEEIYQWANHLFMPYMTGFHTANRRPDQEDEQIDYLEKLAHSANAHGVTLYTIAAVISSSIEGPEFARANEGLGADYLNQANTFAAHEVLSRMTGGLSLNRPKDFDAAFATIARDSQSFYSLGYRPATTTGGERKLTVRVKNRDYSARARQSHQMKSADEVMSDRVVANIFVPAAQSAWQAKVATGDPEKSGETFKVPFEIVAPAQITLLPDGEMLSGGYTVYVAVGTANGALSTVFRQPQSVQIAADEEGAFRKEPLTFGATLTVRPGENIISIGLVDRVSGATSFARTTILAR